MVTSVEVYGTLPTITSNPAAVQWLDEQSSEE